MLQEEKFQALLNGTNLFRLLPFNMPLNSPSSSENKVNLDFCTRINWHCIATKVWVRVWEFFHVIYICRRMWLTIIHTFVSIFIVVFFSNLLHVCWYCWLWGGRAYNDHNSKQEYRQVEGWDGSFSQAKLTGLFKWLLISLPSRGVICSENSALELSSHFLTNAWCKVIHCEQGVIRN